MPKRVSREVSFRAAPVRKRVRTLAQKLRNSCMSPSTQPRSARRRLSVALVGNPNTGKTTIFNALTGFRQRVGNYPGVTVEKKTGPLAGGATGAMIEVVDLPGTYSLTAQSAADDGLTLDVLLGHRNQTSRPDIIVFVADATNLRRNLFVASQTLELGCPVIVALTMTDLVAPGKLDINTAMLGVICTERLVEPSLRAPGRWIVTVTSFPLTLPDLAMNFSMPCSWTG